MGETITFLRNTIDFGDKISCNRLGTETDKNLFDLFCYPLAVNKLMGTAHTLLQRSCITYVLMYTATQRKALHLKALAVP